MKMIKLVKENLLLYIFASMFIGTSIGYLLDMSSMKVLINYVLFLMIYPMMINLDVVDVIKEFKEIKPIITSLLMNFIISPLIAISIGKMFFAHSPELFLAILIIALLPSSGMSASWTGLAEGNMKMTLVLMSINLLVSIIVMPFYISIFASEALSIDMIVVTKSLLKIIVIPLILGDLTRRLIYYFKGERNYRKMKPLFSGISSIGVILIVFLAMSLKSRMIISHLNLVLYSLLPISIYYISQLVISDKIGRAMFNDKERISFVYTIVLRNLTIALGIAMGAFGNSLGIVIITIAYIIQIPIGTIYMKYSKKLIPSEVN
jgi:ACR3 family arsenite efflux pump ArsB